jgi:putative DNA primase/helicase
MLQYGEDWSCEHGEPPDDCPQCDPYNIDPDAEPLTDLGNARRLVAAHGKDLRFIPPWKKWFVWDTKRWARDVTAQHHRWAKEIARSITEEARKLPDGSERRKMLAEAKKATDTEVKKALTEAAELLPTGEARKHMMDAGRRAESAPGIRGMLELAGTEPGVVLDPVELDSEPNLLNTQSGMLDLETGILWPHDPSRNLTKITAAGYDETAQAPQFAAFLERIQPDPKMREFLARLLGHALMGKVTEHILPIFHGVGANGKSTLVELVRKVLGDYAATVDPGLLIDRGETHPTGVADLFGLRLAITHETDSGRRLAEGTIKRLTGGDLVTARRMREDFWSFEPTHSLVMITNHAPVVTGTDEGIWRRLRIVPFEVVIPVEERDSDLPDRLYEERDGVLRWLIEGYRAYLQHGLNEPDKVTEATKGYRNNSDMLGLFLDEKCYKGGGEHVSVRSKQLYDAWVAWCVVEGIKEPGTNKAFSTEIEKRGYDKKNDNRGAFWKGLGLQTDDQEEPS